MTSHNDNSGGILESCQVATPKVTPKDIEIVEKLDSGKAGALNKHFGSWLATKGMMNQTFTNGKWVFHHFRPFKAGGLGFQAYINIITYIHVYIHTHVCARVCEA